MLRQLRLRSKTHQASPRLRGHSINSQKLPDFLRYDLMGENITFLCSCTKLRALEAARRPSAWLYWHYINGIQVCFGDIQLPTRMSRRQIEVVPKWNLSKRQWRLQSFSSQKLHLMDSHCTRRHTLHYRWTRHMVT